MPRLERRRRSMNAHDPTATNESAARTPTVSVVICTRNRADKIGAAVASVLANEYPAFDLTVIDQSTTDDTAIAVREIAAKDPRVNYVHSDAPGLSRAYNNGIRRSTGEILAFTDDDCVAPSDWIENDCFGIPRGARSRPPLWQRRPVGRRA